MTPAATHDLAETIRRIAAEVDVDAVGAPLDNHERFARVGRALVRAYLRNPSSVAQVLDEAIDPSGATLGHVRAAALNGAREVAP